MLNSRHWLVTIVACFGLCVPSGLSAESARRLAASHEGNCFNPVISPDGKAVAYEVNYFEKRVIELFVYDLTANSEVQVTPKRMGGASSSTLANFGMQKKQVTYELNWQPNRPKNYVFSSSGDDENYNLYFSNGGVIADHPAADGMPIWSKDARFIIFTSSRTGEGDLYLVDIQNVEDKPRRLTSFDDSTEWYPSFGPDGKQLLFVRHFSKGGDNLYIMKNFTDGSGLVQLTDWPSIQTKPSWSPDGKLVAFYSNRNAKDRYDLFVMEAAASATPRMLVEGVIPNERQGPAWSADGKGVLFVKDDPERFNPIRFVNVADPTKIKTISTGTQNNGDLYMVSVVGGKPIIAFTAQGRIGDDKKSFKRVFTLTLSDTDLSF